MNKLLFTAVPFALALAANAQQHTALTAKDYQRAESFLTYNTEPLVDHGSVRPNWLPGDKFWFRDLNAKGSEFILVDPVKKSKSATFDQQKLASALSAATGKTYEALMLPFQTFTFSTDGKSIIFKADDKQWRCDLQTYNLNIDTNKLTDASSRQVGRRGRRGNEVLSPDGKKAAFIKDYNLWVRDVNTKKETQLTTDGVKNFGYATDNAGWTHSDAPILLWSPDSKKIAT